MSRKRSFEECIQNLLNSYALSPYVILARDNECEGAIRRAQASQVRIQKLVLISPPLWRGDKALEIKQILSTLDLAIEVYVDCEESMDFFAPFGVVQWWKI